METIEEYHKRRILEMTERINYLQNYIDNNTAFKHKENSVGGSYIKRRNSRISANNEYRINEFKSEIEQLNKYLENHISQLK